ncbi:MAG: glycosyltransferase [Rhodospirillaceae bacterium]
MSEAFRVLAATVQGYLAWMHLEVGSLRKQSRGSREKRALLLAWDLPPRFSSGTFRPRSFVHFGERHGWTIDSFSGPVPSVPPPADADAYELGRRGDSACFVEPRCTPSFRFFPRLHGGFFEALLATIQLRRRFHQRCYATIIASGPPFSVFVTGFYASRHWGASLVLDYRDEWTESPFTHTHTRFDLWWERRCQRAADLVIFTTESQRTHQLSVFPDLSPEKTIVLPNGWDPSVEGGRKTDVARGSDVPATIAYVGKLGSHVPTGEFLNALNEAVRSMPDGRRNLTVSFIGEIDGVARRQLADSAGDLQIDTPGVVDQKTALGLMSEADILLLMSDMRLQRYRPGKLYDYLAAGRPILVYGERGEISDIVEELGAGLHVPPDDVDRLSAILSGQEKLPDPTRSPKLAAWLARHSREELARTLIRTLEEIEANRAT